MNTTNVREARKRLSALLDQVERGESVVISRRGKPVARLVAAHTEEPVRFPSRAKLRQSLPPAKESSAGTIRALREEERF
ncbi:type II toxin-antitoxin system prevent-host-death family antitoxin [Wenzhouxiangella sp. AB-CW3]|uniref:type II toxin-antitoxin system Phd/YefM family antitoxin n=1 Tax=Wenzhouxiangella sp. AB-CW3 TaxID=2771012 RepID=UPI00168BCD04|nr:type II toxin-antitoxin system prevent-host-death family antitoxin [Wenzhouxiangella sp. AB-CW3]QOC21935.1 type II toxin-antitoxin system prevent-host-death family antitoxin [Wenzhouxiangella sp. AB-CW3]